MTSSRATNAILFFLATTLVGSALQSQRQRPGGGQPRDRSDFSYLREEGFPLNLDPEIVTATDVPLADSDMVMGIVHNGEVRAYPVNYMNGPTNEIVNDTLGGTPVAPSW